MVISLAPLEGSDDAAYVATDMMRALGHDADSASRCVCRPSTDFWCVRPPFDGLCVQLKTHYGRAAAQNWVCEKVMRKMESILLPPELRYGVGPRNPCYMYSFPYRA